MWSMGVKVPFRGIYDYNALLFHSIGQPQAMATLAHALVCTIGHHTILRHQHIQPQ
jgi:hypothetical protein